MSRRRSPIVGKRYPLRTVCNVWRVPRSSVYALTAAAGPAPTGTKRGPKTAQSSDVEVVMLIRAIVATSPFQSEGHRNVRVRLRQRGVHVGKARVLRLMRGHGLSAPTLPGHVHGDPAHAGRITTDHPDELWGTNATCFWTERAGWCWFFGAIDHATDELVGWKATKRGDRWAALQPLYQGMRYAFGRLGKYVARGLTVRTDWGPQYTAHAFGAELRCSAFSILLRSSASPGATG